MVEYLIALAVLTATLAVYLRPNLTRRAYTLFKRFRAVLSAILVVLMTFALLSTGSFEFVVIGFVLAVYIVLFVHYEKRPLSVAQTKIRRVIP